jgi:hypothetical protein
MFPHQDIQVTRQNGTATVGTSYAIYAAGQAIYKNFYQKPAAKPAGFFQ